jgi:hypothetical protein
METSEKQIAQNNTYEVFDSMGRSTGNYVFASNIKEANIEMVKLYKERKIASLNGKVKRCWSGGVMGSR